LAGNNDYLGTYAELRGTMGFILKEDEYPPRNVIKKVLDELMDLVGYADDKDLNVICSMQSKWNRNRTMNFNQLNYLKIIRTRLQAKEKNGS
jgi:plasmid replication initiation protein